MYNNFTEKYIIISLKNFIKSATFEILLFNDKDHNMALKNCINIIVRFTLVTWLQL